MIISRKRIILYAILIAIACAMCFLNHRYKLFAFNISHYGGNEGFSIMTYNISAYDSASFTTDRQHRLIELIKQEKPDFLCFQEMSFESLKQIKPQLDSIYGSCDVLEGDNQLWRLRFYSHYPLRNFRRYKCEGVIDTSDFTEEVKAEVELFQKQMNVMSAEFEVEPERWVTVFSGHLRSSAYSTARRSMNKGASWFEGISLYKRNYDVGKRIRDYEAQNVRRFVEDARTSTSSATRMPVIVSGDLNDWCGSDCLDILMGFKGFQKASDGFNGELKDAWWEGGNGFGWTYFGWHLRLRLDHILYSDEFELAEVKVVDTDISDHKPLVAKFKFKK